MIYSAPVFVLYMSMGRIFSWEVGIAFHNFRLYTEWLKLFDRVNFFGKKADEILVKLQVEINSLLKY
jgi:hypothetical protein